MASDYQAILERNIEEYGRGTKHLSLLSDVLYSDRTHFIFELLQNAEDVAATHVSFELRADQVLVRHDGKRLFDGGDVRAICGLGDSRKTSDLTAIGRFGIGFKSVHSFTESPEVHSGDEHFMIRDYVRPHAVEARHVSRGETLFVLPFDSPKVPARQAYDEILQGLKTFQARSLLFLRHIRRVSWSTPAGGRGSWSRIAQPDGKALRVTVGGEGEAAEEWLVFDRDVTQTPAADRKLRVEAAFKLEAIKPGAPQKRVVPLPVGEAKLFVFFPTKMDTSLGFLLQGHYRTTTSREWIPDADPTNKLLARETATLVAEALTSIRDLGLAGRGLLETLPLQDSRLFAQGGLFRLLFEKVVEVLKREPLLPTDRGGGFVSGSQGKLARVAALRELFGPAELTDLFQAKKPLAWLSADITHDRPPLLWGYLRDVVRVEEVTTENFPARLNDKFLQRRTDGWTIAFYSFLMGHRSLWERKGASALPMLLQKPIIRLERSVQRTPFLEDGRPVAYLPSREAGTLDPADFRFVARSIARDDQASLFLKALGFTEPDVVDHVFERVLPRYQSTTRQLPEERQHNEDLAMILRALRADCSVSKRTRLEAELRTTSFLSAVNASSGARALRHPTGVYLRSAELEVYLEGNLDAWFVDHELEVSDVQLLERVGLSRVVRTFVNRRPDTSGRVLLSEVADARTCGVDGFDPAVEIDGLNHALARPSARRSAVLWQTLRREFGCLRGWVETFDASGAPVPRTRRQQEASLLPLLRNRAWLPDSRGSLRRPGELSLSDLQAAAFEPHTMLASLLGMAVAPVPTSPQAHVRSLEQELGLNLDGLTDLFGLLKEKGVPLTEIVRDLRATMRPVESSDSEASEAPVFSYANEFAARFLKPQLAKPTGEEAPVAGEVADPARRRARVNQDIASARSAEPAREVRSRTTERRIWESKDPQVRAFLLEQYRGQCQVCGDRNSFQRRDGTPYFEACHVVSRLAARWIDRPGNVLSLCALCSSKFAHGEVVQEDFAQVILALKTREEGGTGDLVVALTLCGREERLRYSERHLIDAQEILRSALAEPAVRCPRCDSHEQAFLVMNSQGIEEVRCPDCLDLEPPFPDPEDRR